ncbi:MAG: T9SS C-terminal target domain-containing protein [Cytophagales bacterium]|nr:MAG: T9SS C-terminal target domain-containing protein [Cytophagales bacterium]
MKKIFVIVFILFYALQTFGQSFKVEHKETKVSALLEDYLANALIGVTSISFEDSLAWKVVRKNLPNKWTFTVCEVPGRCYLPGTESAKFEILKGQTVEIDVGFYPEDVIGEGDIEIEVWNPKNLKEKVNLVFKASFSITSIEKSKNINSLGIFPNPVNELFTINKAQLNSLYHIYNEQGQIVRSFITSSIPFEVNVADLKPGVYMVNNSNQSSSEGTKLVVLK